MREGGGDGEREERKEKQRRDKERSVREVKKEEEGEEGRKRVNFVSVSRDHTQYLPFKGVEKCQKSMCTAS